MKVLLRVRLQVDTRRTVDRHRRVDHRARHSSQMEVLPIRHLNCPDRAGALQERLPEVSCHRRSEPCTATMRVRQRQGSTRTDRMLVRELTAKSRPPALRFPSPTMLQAPVGSRAIEENERQAEPTSRSVPRSSRSQSDRNMFSRFFPRETHAVGDEMTI